MGCPPTPVRILLVVALAGSAALHAHAGDRSLPFPGRFAVVHCPRESVGAVLQAAAQQFPTGPLTITLRGVCVEAVDLTRDETTLRGAGPGAGLQAPSPESIVLTLRARRTRLEQLALTGGSEGLRATEAASFSATDLLVSAATNTGVLVEQNSTGELHSSSVENAHSGIVSRGGGTLRMFGGTVDTIDVSGLGAFDSGHIALYDGAAVRHTGHVAVHAAAGGSILLSDAIVEDGSGGVLAIWGGTATLQNGTLVQNNRDFGVAANDNGTVLLGDGVRVAGNFRHGVVIRSGASFGIGGALIENNGGDGVSIGGGSTVSFAGGTIVRNNHGHGIALSATSVATFFDDTAQVTGNEGTAVVCFEGSAAQVVGDPGTISGNGVDEVQCDHSFP